MTIDDIPVPAPEILEDATRIADELLAVQTRVNAQIDATLADLLPGVRRRLGIDPTEPASTSPAW